MMLSYRGHVHTLDNVEVTSRTFKNWLASFAKSKSHRPPPMPSTVPLNELLCDRFREFLEVPSFVLRIQDGGLWDYSFYRGRTLLDTFSTRPENWEDDPDYLDEWRGKPELVAKEWGVPLDRIENYYVPMGTDRPGRRRIHLPVGRQGIRQRPVRLPGLQPNDGLPKSR